MKYVKNDNTWSLTPDARLDVRDALPPGNYTVCQDPLTKEYFLEESESFEIPGKLYGKITSYGERILQTFRDRKPDDQVGVFLSGSKGSGKTLLAKYVSNTSGLPVIIVNSPYADDRFMRTIQGISQPAVILFDEFEKLYDKEAQESILTLFDGVYTARNKIMIITCNDRFSVREFFHNRPSRLRYAINFEGLSADFIEEYCNDRLIDRSSYLDKILGLSAVCEEFNFDMLQALVQELNRYGGSFEDAIEILNVKPLTAAGTTWRVSVSTPDHRDRAWRIARNEVLSTSPTIMISSPRFCREIDVSVAPARGSQTEDDEDEDLYYLTLTTDNMFRVDPYSGTYVFKVRDRGLEFLVTVAEEKKRSSLYGGYDVGRWVV